MSIIYVQYLIFVIRSFTVLYYGPYNKQYRTSNVSEYLVS